MTVGLKVTYLYHDVDIIEVRVTAENGRFRGSTDVYVVTDGLLEGAAALQGFPKDRRDKPDRPVRSLLEVQIASSFIAKDLSGHTAFRAVIEDDYKQQELTQSAMVFIDFEPAAQDQFLVELQQVEREHRGSAALITEAS
jgi:hypothetical protein